MSDISIKSQKKSDEELGWSNKRWAWQVMFAFDSQYLFESTTKTDGVHILKYLIWFRYKHLTN